MDEAVSKQFYNNRNNVDSQANDTKHISRNIKNWLATPDTTIVK